MSYTVNETNQVVDQDANTTDVDLSGLTGLVDSSGNPIVTTSGGDQDGDAGTQIVYTLAHPFVFKIRGAQTITPDADSCLLRILTNATTNKTLK